MKKTLSLLLLFACGSAFAFDRSDTGITVENVIREMNAMRAAKRLPPLVVNDKLTRAAESRMQDMIDGEWWSHESPDGMSPFVWLSAAGYDYMYAAENLAAGFETSPVLLEAWMESPGHRANIMGVQYSECGIAVIEGSTKGRALGKSVVVLFGRQKTPLLTVQRTQNAPLLTRP